MSNKRKDFKYWERRLFRGHNGYLAHKDFMEVSRTVLYWYKEHGQYSITEIDYFFIKEPANWNYLRINRKAIKSDRLRCYV